MSFAKLRLVLERDLPRTSRSFIARRLMPACCKLLDDPSEDVRLSAHDAVSALLRVVQVAPLEVPDSEPEEADQAFVRHSVFERNGIQGIPMPQEQPKPLPLPRVSPPAQTLRLSPRPSHANSDNDEDADSDDSDDVQSRPRMSTPRRRAFTVN